MTSESLIRAVLGEANKHGNTYSGSQIVEPLKRFGQVWFDGSGWRFSEQRAEIGLYSENSVTRNYYYGEGQFEVKLPTEEEAKQAWERWNSGLGRY